MTTDGDDLDHSLRLDNCEACGAIDWKDCVCSPDARAHRTPTAAELERSRAERLSQAERKS